MERAICTTRLYQSGGMKPSYSRELRGLLIFLSVWRRGRDSNPRYGCPYVAFRVRCFQPLSHLSNPRCSEGHGGLSKVETAQYHSRAQRRKGLTAESAKSHAPRPFTHFAA